MTLMATEIMGLEARLERVESGGKGGKEMQGQSTDNAFGFKEVAGRRR